METATNSPRQRVLFIGLDGATWDIARPLMDAGRLPNLARLVAAGTAGPLASTVPPISAAAWVTFLTGQNPGRHGVYQFRKMDMAQYGGYRDEFATSNDYRGRSLLELAGQQGRRVGAVGVPMTYPPFPVNGFLVSGFPRPFGPQAQVYPPELAGRLGRWDEMADNFNFSLSPEKTLEAADYWVRRYTDIAVDALAGEDFDLFLIVWNSTDNIPHHYWKYHDPAFPAYDGEGARRFGEVINRQYQLADAEIGRLLDALPDPANTTVVLMSDHGMGAYPHRQVHLNTWLAAEGWLAQRPGAQVNGSLLNRGIRSARQRLPDQWRHRLRQVVPRRLWSGLFRRQLNLGNVDWARTRAYRLGVFPSVDGIVINLRGRQARGIVEPGADYEALCRQIVAGLVELRDPQSGELIVARASHRDELFSGPHVGEIPDILVELNEAWCGGPALDGPLVTDMPADQLSAYSATHRPTGLFVACGPGIAAGGWLEDAQIVDMAPTLLHVLGLPVSAAMDGRVLQDLFEPAARRAVQVAEYTLAEGAADQAGLSRAEEAAFREQLQGLGYL